MANAWIITERYKVARNLLANGTTVPATGFILRCPSGHGMLITAYDAKPAPVDIECPECRASYPASF